MMNVSWTKEEMEAYVKLRKSLTSKSRHRKSVSKSSSFPRSSTPSLDLDIDDRFKSQLDSINKSVDSKIAALSENSFAQFSSMLGQFKLELSNPCLSEEPEVSGRTPSSGQSLPLRRPVRIDVQPHLFQGTVEGPMPWGSGITRTSSVSDTTVRSELGADVAQSQDSLREEPEVAQDPQASSGHRVSFASSWPEIRGAQEPEEDDRNSFYEPQVVDKTLNRLFHYVYDKFLESCPLSYSLAPPCCEFESFFSVAEPQSAACPQLRIYPRVNELVADTSE